MGAYFNDKEEEIVPEEGGVESVFDDIDETDGNQLARIKELKEQLKEVEMERKEYLDGWQRSKADYLNISKRFTDEKAALISRAEDSVIEKLLPLCDSFDAALSTIEEEGLRDGLSRIHNQLQSTLKELGVTEVSNIGVPFDPHIHEALKNERVDERAMHDTVTIILQKGYRRRDRLLRPAKVVVGSFEDTAS